MYLRVDLFVESTENCFLSSPPHLGLTQLKCPIKTLVVVVVKWSRF